MANHGSQVRRLPAASLLHDEDRVAAPRPPLLVPGQVDVWRISLSAPPHLLSRVARTLAAEEHARAAGFRSRELRDGFIVARGALRDVLGRYLEADPAALRFRYTPHGKPELEGARIRFNLSHSGAVALVAVTLDRPIGVDVERMRTMHHAVAARFFSTTEREHLLRLPAEARDLAFTRCWTRKEAYIKAVGSGLAMPLREFSVSLAPGEPPRLLAASGEDAHRWTLRELLPGPGYVGTVAAEGEIAELRCYGWPPPEPSSLCLCASV